MMFVGDGIQLASAKLRTHRIRTGVVVFIASLLFAAIACVLVVFTGAARSMNSFGDQGLTGRYIVQAHPIVDGQSLNMGTPEILDRMKARSVELKKEKKLEAKRLGIDYDSNSDLTLPVVEYKSGMNGTTEAYLNSASKESADELRKYANSLPHISFTDFSTIAKKASAKAIYRSSMPAGQIAGGQNASVAAIVDGKELSADSSMTPGNLPSGVSTLTTLGWTYFDAKLLKPFLLPGQNLALGKEGDVPVIAPMSAAEQMLGLSKLPSTATSSQRLDRLVKVRKDIAGKVSELCYRNESSLGLLQQAKSQENTELQNKKDGVRYTPPTLQYSVPTQPCAAVEIKRDARTYEERSQTLLSEGFKKKYENYEDPIQQILKVRVVGLTPDMNYAPGFSARTIIEGVLQSNLGIGWFSPAGAITAGSTASRVRPSIDQVSNAEQVYYAEFPTMAQAKMFAKNYGCESKASFNYAIGPPQIGQQDPRVVDCNKMGKYFDISPYGNNANAIEDMRQSIWRVMRYVVPVVLALSSLVLMGIVGKIIADSRRETAVFRALGATRLTIAQIYLTYSLFIAGIISVMAFGIGFVGAAFINEALSPDLSVSAVLAYNSEDVHRKFTLFGIDPTYMALIVGLVVLASLLSTVIPLLTNIRRNPIGDMRDE